MTAPGSPAPVVVTGGAGGIDANRGAIDHLAGLFDAASSGLDFDAFEVTTARHRLPTDTFAAWRGPAAFDPAGLAVGEQLLAEALADVRAAASETGSLARNLRNAARGYPWGTDVLDLTLLGSIERGLGRLRTAPGLGWLDGDTVDGHGSLANGSDGRISGWDPGLVSGAIGLIDPPAAAGLLGPTDDRPGVAVPTGSAPVRAPRGLSDLLTSLGDVDRTATPGGIDVRILHGADGTDGVVGAGGRRVIVDITGTRTWRVSARNVADLTTNELALDGRSGAYEAGVLAAMRHAGVRRDDKVMLVGHSQGGMVAITTARDAVRSGEFTVTHVVTAGSPVGQTVGSVPRSVRVLALENPGDIVPLLDARPNPDRPNITTARSPHGDGSVGGNHAIDESYVPLAHDVQADGSRSVRDFLDSADGYFRADHATAHAYRVERR